MSDREFRLNEPCEMIFTSQETGDQTACGSPAVIPYKGGGDDAYVCVDCALGMADDDDLIGEAGREALARESSRVGSR